MDRGWRVVVVEDAFASSAPEGHRAALDPMRTRFSCQIGIAAARVVLAAWPAHR
ncbi:MAG TPA: hypothetical protein VFO84_00840 [Dehalococcoidia bacterium]|nr:hypothetical protein [Dehalococcoidia bacterium]